MPGAIAEYFWFQIENFVLLENITGDSLNFVPKYCKQNPVWTLQKWKSVEKFFLNLHRLMKTLIIKQ